MTGSPFRILLVEDNAADVYLFRKALQNAELHFELTVIGDGAMAIEYARGEGEHEGKPVPDLTAIDLNLPKTTASRSWKRSVRSSGSRICRWW